MDCRLEGKGNSKVMGARKCRSEKLQLIWKEKRIKDFELGHFLGLPIEVWLSVLRYLPAQDLIKFGKTCVRAYELSEDPTLWKSIYMQRSKTRVLFDFGENWKAAYTLVRVSSENNSSLTLQKELYNLQDELSMAEEENHRISSTLSQLRSTLDFLSTSDANSPITDFEERIFRNLLRKEKPSQQMISLKQKMQDEDQRFCKL